jgi:hypothetical protein
MRNIMIRSQPNGEIDYDDLRETLRIRRDVAPIIFANIGTTMKEARDDVGIIRSILDDLAIEEALYPREAACVAALPLVAPAAAWDFDDGQTALPYPVTSSCITYSHVASCSHRALDRHRSRGGLHRQPGHHDIRLTQWPYRWCCGMPFAPWARTVSGAASTRRSVACYAESDYVKSAWPRGAIRAVTVVFAPAPAIAKSGNWPPVMA